MHHDATGLDGPAAPSDEATGVHDGQEQTYPVDPRTPIVLDVSCQTADVSIRATARLDVLVRARGAGDRPGSGDSPPGVRVAADGNRIAVSTNPGDWGAAMGSGGAGNHRDRRRGLGGWLSFGRVEAESVTGIEIETPVGAFLRLTMLTGAGDVHLDGLAGELTMRAGAGDLVATGCVGQIQADAGAGDVRFTDSSGTIRVQTGSGDVTIERGSLESTRFRSGSGDLAIRGAGLGAGPFEVQTGAGDVLLDVYRSDRSDEPIGIRYVALSGDAHVGAGFARLRGRSAEGAQPLVSVHTASGDLVARRTIPPAAQRTGSEHGDEDWSAATRIPVAGAEVAADEAGIAESSPVADPKQPGVDADDSRQPVGDMSPTRQDFGPQGSSPTRIAVLEAVARGELDIDEALRRLA